MTTCEFMIVALLTMAAFLDNSCVTFLCMVVMFIIFCFSGNGTKYGNDVVQSETLANDVKYKSKTHAQMFKS